MEICYLNLQDIACRRYIRERQRTWSNVLVVGSITLVIASVFLFYFNQLHFFSSFYFLFTSIAVATLAFVFGLVYGNRNMDTYVRITDNGVEWRYKIWGKVSKVKWSDLKGIETKDNELFYVKKSGKTKMGVRSFGVTTSSSIIEKVLENSKLNGVSIEQRS